VIAKNIYHGEITHPSFPVSVRTRLPESIEDQKSSSSGKHSFVASYPGVAPEAYPGLFIFSPFRVALGLTVNLFQD
jgi:hypothetical protein